MSLALALSGCASLYQPHIQTFSLRGGDAHQSARVSNDSNGVDNATAPTLTTFEQWTSLWSAVCGAVVDYKNGEPMQVIAGNCGTPLTLFMGAPMNAGLAAAVAAMVK